MIDAKRFMEFFEKEFNVQFIDAQTGKKALDLITEDEKRKYNPYADPAYRSDYDDFLEKSGAGEIG